MDWVKLSTRFYLDPAVASLPDADSELLFVRSLAYAGAEETGGFIPRSVVSSLVRGRRYRAHVEALVAHSLWVPASEPHLEGWHIARWEDWQEELEALARRRAADRARKRRERQARKADTPQGVSEKLAERKPQAKGMSRDMSAGQSRDSHGTRPHPPHTPPYRDPETEDPPYPPQAGGTRAPVDNQRSRCTRHKARPKPWCDDCHKPPVVRPDSKTLAEALADPACPHGTPAGVACALCRRGIPAEDTG